MLGLFDDVEAFLSVFEQTAHHEWSYSLTLQLTGEAKLAYYALLTASTDDYIILKEEILAWCGLFPCQAGAKFHHWKYQPNIAPQRQVDTLL